MHQRSLRGALALALTATLALAGIASADSARADGDAATAGNQSLIDLGQVGPGATVSASVAFQLVCTNTATFGHLEPGQAVALTYGSGSAPLDGAIVSASAGATAQAPAGWPVDGDACPSPAPTVDGGTPSIVTLRAPTTPGAGYLYSVSYARSLTPAGNADAGALNGVTGISFELEVVANTPPVLTVPADVTVEGDTAGGWTADWPGVTAADAEDDPDPTPVCSPAAGEVLPLGTTSVSCTATDTDGAADGGTFDVTVVDTAAPAIGPLPDIAVSTPDAAGATVAWDVPAATDVVDADPAVACAPASGSVFPVGTTAVVCTASDDSGNAASTAFEVTVTHDPDHTATAVWGEPVGAEIGTFVANRGRTLPVKVTLAVDGVAQTTGTADLRVIPCSGGDGLVIGLTYGGGRWSASLDTTRLGGDCHTVLAAIDGLEAGSFTLHLRGSEPAAAGGPGKSGKR